MNWRNCDSGGDAGRVRGGRVGGRGTERSEVTGRDGDGGGREGPESERGGDPDDACREDVAYGTRVEVAPADGEQEPGEKERTGQGLT